MSRLTIPGSWTLVVLLCIAAQAQDSSAPRTKDEVSTNAAQAAEFAVVEAQRYVLSHADQAARKLALLPQPVLRWSNPTNGEVHGSVVLWTRNGCPEAAASIYQFFDRDQINVELVSLSESPLKGIRSGRLRWTPQAGVKFAILPGGPTAAETAGRRQFQMRSLARKFTGSLADRNDDSILSQLRLMARPLHAYESSDGSRDGAVFALVNTTDPEILLMIESRRKDDGRQWMFAAARMHFCRLQLKLEDEVVWEVPQLAPPWEGIRGPKGSYVILEWKTEAQAAADKAASAAN